MLRVLVLSILGSLAWAQTPVRTSPPSTSTKGTSAIRGKVLTTSGQPVRKAEVIFRKMTDPNVEYTTKAGADGQFAMEGLPAGQYIVDAERVGFVRGFARPINVGPGLVPDEIEVKMAPQSVITGRVTDEDGDAIANASVELVFAADPSKAGSGPRYGVGGRASTNDLGEYRIAGIGKGRYVLSAGANEFSSSSQRVIRSGPDETLQKLYYPGIADQAQAKPIEIAEGAQLHDFDFQLKRVRAYRIRGKLIRPENADDRIDFLTIHPRESHSWGGPTTQVSPDGSFEMGSQLPGSYVIEAHVNVNGHQISRAVSVEVKDQDVEGVVISFVDGLKIEGEIHAVGAAEGFKASLVSVVLAMEEYGIAGSQATTPSADGTFVLTDLAPGDYHVYARMQGEEGYVKSISYNGSELTDHKLELRPGAAGGRLEITVAFDMGSIDGVVLNASGAPAAGAAVLLYDEDQTACLCSKSATADSRGQFRMEHVPPGDHYMAATSSGAKPMPDADPEEDPRKNGTKVTVAPHGQQSVTLKIR